MRRALAALLLALIIPGLAIAGGLTPQTAEERPEDARAIQAHIDSIFRAYIDRDRDRIRSTHSEDWRGFLRPSGTVIRGIEAYMQAAEAALSGPYGLSGYEFLEYDVIFYGDTAVVSYIAELVPRRIPFRPMIRVLDVYALVSDHGDSEGHWIQVASQTAPHPDTLAAGRQQPFPISDPLRKQILEAREQVWRSWFENRDDLNKVLPPELIAINAGEEEWRDRTAVIANSASFAAKGGRLLRLEFPQTEIQLFGDVAILYTLYSLEIEADGERSSVAGRGTEIFVRRDGAWVNSGWHLDSGE